MKRSPYTRERLSEAAAGARTLSEALVSLGVDPKGPARRYLRERMRRLGVPTEHFTREGTRWTREVLEPAVASSANMSEVLRRLGLDVLGGHHTHLGRRVRALGIDTSHFTGPVRRRGGGGRQDPAAVLVRSPGLTRRVPGERLRRALSRLGVPQRCDLCGTDPLWRGRPLPLEVDHRDGDWRNNSPHNLRLLCPNCHSTTDAYRRRSRGGRPARGGER
ncbi:HNH endonuclease signature motif containing protein [Streptomyces sanyensis]|uniref:HNH endonuclease signature motif containing protein n=1 Tax=Streptomyces sanyensis TaxID=568869 RepID=UPI003D7813F8